MSTLHTTDAQETINRIIDFFPPHEQKQVRLSAAGALIADGGYYGMQSFDQHHTLIRDGVITRDAALVASTSPHDLTVELRRLGLVA